MVTETRRAEIEHGLAAAHARIREAEISAGRQAGSVDLVVVTKTFPAADVAVLAELGVTEVGENRDQEAAPKAAALAGLPLRWHFIGQLQTNKVRSVVQYADVVESVDRPKLVNALRRAAAGVDRRLDVLVQVSLESQPGRGGVDPSAMLEIADAVAESDRLTLTGIMAVAPLGADPVAAFTRLAELAERLRTDHPTARTISAGMSGDLEAAVECGATQVRLGSAVLGYRPPVR